MKAIDFYLILFFGLRVDGGEYTYMILKILFCKKKK